MKFLRNLSKFLFQVFFLSFLLIPESYSSPHCSRGGSRLVRKVLDKNFFPIFENYGVNITEECPLKRFRDLYHIQEEHKLFEHNARWSCQSCGKAFYRQEFLDLHMENKHQDLLVKEELSPVCLADYCQLFRCDALIVFGHHPMFSAGWHGSSQSLQDKLQDLFKQHKVNAYISGHDHNLQHIVPENSSLEHFVCGSSNFFRNWQPNRPKRF